MENTLRKAKKRVEDRFNKYVLKKGKKKDGSMEETQGNCMKLNFFFVRYDGI